MKRRILALSLAAAMVVGALASCTAKTEEVSSVVETRDVKLTLWGSEQDQAFLKEVAAAWATQYAADNADVASATVDVQIKGEDVATTDALNDIEAAADVFGVANDQLAQLTAANAIYQMPDSVVSDIKAIVGDSFLGSTMCDGNYYGFPYAPNTAEILFYNKEFYTDDEAKNLNTMLEKDLGGVTNLAVDIDDQSWNSMTWFATAGAELYTGGDKTVNTMNKPEVTAMLTWLQQQIQAKKIVDIDSADNAAAMLKDKAVGAIFYGAWNKAAFQEALGDNYGVADLPSVTVDGACNNQHLVCFGGNKMLVLNATTKEPEAALSLAQAIISEENQLKRFQMVQQTPTAPALATNADIAADPGVAAEVAQGGYTLTNQPLNGTAGYWDLEKAVVSDLYKGNITADQIQGKLDEMVAAMQANVGA
ncbi:MAG: extracellular solute-binding protein [Clostridia bacterium]|nr:extracellular solute-binding protein [Clostridia bacterium]